MEERQVSVEGVTYKLDAPFMVIATQNPVEIKGTFELPEAQLDRFLVKTGMGYPTHEQSVEILRRKLTPSENAADVDGIDKQTLRTAAEQLASVYVHRDILSYAAAICEATREQKDVLLGASPRAMIALVRVAMGYAAISGRDYVLPDDIKRSARPVLAHRIIFSNSFSDREQLGIKLIDRLLDEIPVPSEQIDFSRR
jgi:MoxR-like ATPase